MNREQAEERAGLGRWAVMLGAASSIGYAKEAETYRISEPHCRRLARRMQAQVRAKKLPAWQRLVWQEWQRLSIVSRTGYQNLEDKKSRCQGQAI